MKVAILAGGYGTRISEETQVRPKPMVEIGGRPIMWHIMKFYEYFGLKDFVILGGYKVEYIREYFLNYRAKECDFTIDLRSGTVEWADRLAEDWRVTVLDTGAHSMTGGRLRRARSYLSDETFCLTYGDGLCDVNLHALIDAHRKSRGWCTLTAVVQPGRYGSLHLSDDGQRVVGFREKGLTDGGLINGGYFVCEPEMIDLIDGDGTVLEEGPMNRLIELGKLASFPHEGYWQSMDSLRDQQVLEAQWAQSPKWKVWD
jgi:glucose-1-phosphate cytidylyltransferase